jgi:uroporphyrinogen decarboxylase
MEYILTNYPLEVYMEEFFPDYANIVKAAGNIQLERIPLYEHSISVKAMENLINISKIDAKHSNEDQIAPFSEWVNRYGDRIGNFDYKR